MSLIVDNSSNSVEVKQITEYKIKHVMIHPEDDNIVIIYDSISNGDVVKTDTAHINSDILYEVIKQDVYSVLKLHLSIEGVINNED